MKLGILGTGMIVKDLLPTLKKLPIEGISILSTEASRKAAEQLAAAYDLDKTYCDYDALLAGDVDAIYVALPNFLHYSFAKKALAHGKHVIIEKPVTANAAELADLIETAKPRGLMIFEAMNIHYLPSFQALKKDLAKLGQIKVVSFNYSQYSSRYDAFKAGVILPAFDCHKAGGALMDINVYNVHAILGLFGVPQAARYHANVEKGIDTSGMMFYDYGGFKAVSIGAKDCKAPIRSTIQGDLAAIVIEKPVNQMTEYRILYNDGRGELRTFDQKEHRLFYEFAAFLRMIEENAVEEQQKALALSLEIAKLMQKTRTAEGIVFDND